jgi:hypothetical protein
MFLLRVSIAFEFFFRLVSLFSQPGTHFFISGSCSSPWFSTRPSDDVVKWRLHTTLLGGRGMLTCFLERALPGLVNTPLLNLSLLPVESDILSESILSLDSLRRLG